MALIDMVGFDRSDTVAHYFNNVGISSGVAINTTAGRFGTKGLNYAAVDSGGVNGNRRDFPGGQILSTVYGGFAIYRGASMGSGNGVFTLYDSASFQVSITISNTGQIIIKRGGGANTGTAIGNSGAFLLAASTSYWLDFKFVINDTTGEAVIRINDVERINLTSVDTKATTNAQVTGWGQSEMAGGNTFGIDDVHIMDTTGSVNNTYPGDRRIITIRPNAAGDDAGGTSSGGGSSVFGNVDDTGTPNGDTDYNLMATSGLKDTFNLEASGLTTATVHGVKVSAYARKTDVSACSLAVIAKSGSTEMTSSAVALGTAYSWVEGAIEEDNNAGPAAWTVSDLDSLKAGYTRTA